MICKGKSVAEIIDGSSRVHALSHYARLVEYVQPRHFLELGTGQGASGSVIMSVLPTKSKFTTINHAIPADYEFGELLIPWASDKRLTMLVGDTTEPDTVKKVVGPVDFMFIDTLHEAWQAATELRLFQSVLENGTLVLVDDLLHNDMMAFWRSLPYETGVVGGQGLFRYDTGKPYMTEFSKPRF